VTVTATSTQDATKSGTATITATLPPTIISLSVSCDPASIQTRQTSQCTATVAGTGSYSSAVTWSVNDVEGGSSTVGTISTSGLCTAPVTVPNPATVTIKATSQADTSKSATATVTINPLVAYRLHGIGFSPYLSGQDPSQDDISDDQIRELLAIIAPYTKWIRTFGLNHGLENIPRIAREYNLKTAVGAWIGADTSLNDQEVSRLIDAATSGYVDIAIVGGEVLLRNDLTEEKLVTYINRFRSQVPAVPVTTAEIYSVLLNHPRLVDACDLVFVNYYPYWEGNDVKAAVAYLHAVDQLVKSRYGASKEIVISETGWPSGGNAIGDAVPTLTNASFYLLNFASWAQAQNRKYFYFEAFDEPWKANYEGPQGAYWGLWQKDAGSLKAGMADVFNGATMPDNWTCQAPPGGSGGPTIELTYVPPIGGLDDLRGQVWHVFPAEYRVAVYIRVSGEWYTKPYWTTPVTIINCDGSWTCDITTGGYDSQADQIAAYLIPTTYNPPLATGQATLPAELDQNAVVKVVANR
jgi:exo-beta-1,3-glucanase (GH17 family)